LLFQCEALGLIDFCCVLFATLKDSKRAFNDPAGGDRARPSWYKFESSTSAINQINQLQAVSPSITINQSIPQASTTTTQHTVHIGDIVKY
jgi:hypothetical protein